MSKRLFVFGCSFTRYMWPTWADIIGKEFEYYENWGGEGGGNQYIFSSLIECHARNNFTQNDEIIVMWSSITREDRYIKDLWNLRGHVENYWDKEYLKTNYCERGFLLRDLTFVESALHLLESLKIKFEFLTMEPLITSNKNDHDILDVFKKSISKLKPSMYEIIFNSNWYSRKDNYFFDKDTIHKAYEENQGVEFYKNLYDNINSFRPDGHPTPLEHLEYVEKILPRYNIANETKNWIKNYKLVDTFTSTIPITRL